MSYILLLVLLFGILLLFQNSFFKSIERLKLRKKRKISIKPKPEEPKFVKLLGRLASSSLNKEITGMQVLWILAILFILVFLVSYTRFLFLAALLISLLFSAMPLLFLFLKLKDQQSKSSKEGIALVTELNRSYRMENRNIYQALEKSLSSDGNFPLCKKQIYSLLLHLRAAASPLEIREACEGFAFSLGTLWGSMLSVCIRVSAEKGSDVSEGLSDIAQQLKEANKRAEARKRLNAEAARMTLFLVPLLYIGTLFLAVAYLDMDLSTLLKNQFGTSEGCLFFSLILLLFLLNRMIMKLVSSVKLDY